MPKMSMEEVRSVLLVATPLRLFLIDPSRLTENPENSIEYQIPPPLPVFREFNFWDMDFPLGMGFFIEESKLYLVGGEIPSEGLSQDVICLTRSCPLVGLSACVYVSDLTSLESITEFRKLSFDMQAPKHNPLIVSVERKIYVISGQSYLYSEDYLPLPKFESYDPLIDQWEALPDPPFHCAYHISAVGTMIYVKAGRYFYCYNVNSMVWDSLGCSTSDIPVHQPLLPEFETEFVPAYDDLLIGLHGKIPFAALIPLDPDGSPIYQSLCELFDIYYSQNILSYSGTIVAMDQHEMCMIKVGQLVDSCVSAYITTFRVEKLHSSTQAFELAEDSLRYPTFDDFFNANLSDVSGLATPFVMITCLTKGFYNLEAWGKDMPFLSGAFFHSWFIRNKRERDPSDVSPRKRLRLTVPSSKRERDPSEQHFELKRQRKQEECSKQL